jgi:hypothetical protein
MEKAMRFIVHGENRCPAGNCQKSTLIFPVVTVREKEEIAPDTPPA